MSELFALTLDDAPYVKAGGLSSVPQREWTYSPHIKRVNTSQGKRALYCLQADAFKPRQSDISQFVTHWHLSYTHDDTEILTRLIKNIRIRGIALSTASTVSVTRLRPRVDSDASVLEIDRTEAANTFIAEHGLERAARAAEDALKKSFEDIRQVRLDFDPGNEEEDDHPWIRVYVQTGMDASSTLSARRQFYKLLHASIPREESAYFHLSFRIVS